MAEGSETSHDNGKTSAAVPAPVTAVPTAATPPAGDLPPAIAALIEGAKVESPPTQPKIEEIAPAEPAPPIAAAPAEPIAPVTDPVAKDIPAAVAPKAELKPEPKMPPAADLAEVVPAAAAPPQFLREHTTRVIPAKPPQRADKPVPKPAPKPAPAPRERRFALLAATVALCAGVGAALGSAGIAGITHLHATIDASAPRADAIAEVHALREQVAQLNTDVAATRSNIEQLNRTNVTQFGKIVERFDRADRAATDPAVKLAKITEAIDRLEKKVAALPPTPAPAPAAAPAPPSPNDVVGSITPRQVTPETRTAPKPQILDAFVLRRVYDGVAVVEGRMGVIEVEPGASIPGGGRVEDIKRQDGHWVVVTSKGLIVSARDRDR